MSQPNPPPLPIPTLNYATPIQASQMSGAWSQNGRLVTTLNCTLPPCCIQCGQPATKTLQKKYYWHEPWVYALILPGLLIYAIVAIALRKSATINFGLCAMHVAARTKRIIICWSVAGLGLASLIFGICLLNRMWGRTYEDTGLVCLLGGIFTMLIAAILGATLLAGLRPKKMDNNYAWFTGAGEEFLGKLDQI